MPLPLHMGDELGIPGVPHHAALHPVQDELGNRVLDEVAIDAIVQQYSHGDIIGLPIPAHVSETLAGAGGGLFFPPEFQHVPVELVTPGKSGFAAFAPIQHETRNLGMNEVFRNILLAALHDPLRIWLPVRRNRAGRAAPPAHPALLPRGAVHALQGVPGGALLRGMRLVDEHVELHQFQADAIDVRRFPEWEKPSGVGLAQQHEIEVRM
ncbi:MAG: hypothetical protein F4X09_04160 [Gammaproteobacteria bacterium]|nr:hypothetical protein [Gammaproteobacteria bacterium]